MKGQPEDAKFQPIFYGYCKKELSDFFCLKNYEIEEFVRKNAIEFAKRKMSITYLVVDGESRLDESTDSFRPQKHIAIYLRYGSEKANGIYHLG